MKMRRAFSLFLVFAAAASALAQSGGRSAQRRLPGTGNPDEYLVPWKFIEKGGDLAKQPLDLYWIPASVADVEKSPLRTSRVLLDDSSWCIALEVIAPEDAALIAKLGVIGKLPAAVLTDAQGNVITTIEGVRGVLRAAAVEEALTAELNKRDEAMVRALTQARQLAAAGDKERAIALYKTVWDDRCLFPVGGTEAQRGLKELGVTVKETPAPAPVDPYLQPKTTTRH